MRRIFQHALIAVAGLAMAGCGSDDVLLPTPKYFNVSGNIIANGSDITDVIISDGTHSAVPDSTGKWTIYRLSKGNYVFDAHKVGLAFTPETRQVTIKDSNVTGVDFSVATGGESIDMLALKGGTFMMGLSGDNDAMPLHLVTVGKFRMGKFEITQQEWKNVMPTNPSGFNGDNAPVERVTWYEAVKFCNALSAKDGFTPAYTINGENVSCNFQANGYRLPTEAEWEYAARAGTATVQYSTPIGDLAWYSENANSRTHPVGQKRANQFGLYDMYGNIFEWCWDWRNLYTGESQTNPVGPATGSLKMLRGGSWFFEAYAQNSGFRLAYEPVVRYNGVGFRVVRSAQ